MTFSAISALSNHAASPVRFMGRRSQQEAVLHNKSSILSDLHNLAELRKLNEEYELKDPKTTLFLLA